MSAERTLLAGIASVLTVAGSIAKISNGPRVLLAKLGWDLPQGIDDIGLAGLDMARVGTRLTTWATRAADPEASSDEQAVALADLAEAVVEVLDDLGDLRLEAPQDYLDRSGIKDDFLTRLFDLYLIQSAAVASRPAFDVAMLLGWFELQRHDADPTTFQVAHLRHVVHWDRVPMLFSDPAGLLREAYGWGTATFATDALVTRLGSVLQHLATEVRRRELPAIPLARLHGGVPPVNQPQVQLFLPLLGSTGPLTGEAGISVFGLPSTAPGATDGGIGLAPYATGSASLRVPLSSTLSVGMSAHADLGSGLALVFRPDSSPVLRTALNEPQAGTGDSGAEVKLDLTLAVPQGTEAMTLLSAGGAKIEATSVALAVNVLVDGEGTDATLRLQVQGGRVTLTPDGLPFLGAGPSTGGLVAEADIDLSWSHRHGIRLDGRAGLQVSRVIGRRIGPVTIDVLGIGLATSDSSVTLTAAVSATVTLGPVLLVVEQIGIRAAITPGSGNLGSADLTIRPTPPSGVGLVIDTPLVVGGGYLFFDPEKAEYGGILQLEVAETIAVKAIGLLTTRLPGGAKGYSLLILISAEGFAPIQLGFGFTLTGIGGLLGVNRTARVDVLRNGLKQGTLGSILFPQDPIRNAAADRERPARRVSAGAEPVPVWPDGHHRVGHADDPDPRARADSGTARTGAADHSGPPAGPAARRAHAVVRVRMDAIGVIDFNSGEVSLDAILYDSRILAFTLTGEMALRASWGTQPRFVLAIGGFHPRFAAPAEFPKLKRLALEYLG